MKLLKRISATFIACSMFLIMACGCSTGNSEEPKNPQPENPSEKSSDDEPVGFSFTYENYGVGIGAECKIAYSSNTDVVFNSNNPEVLEISGKNLCGIAAGQATLTAEIDGGEVATATVYVGDKKYSPVSGEEPLIAWKGRNFADETGLYCYNTAGGFATSFYGTSLSATITAAGNVTPQLCVLVDGKTNATENVVSLSKSKSTQSYSLVSGLEEGMHTVEVYKITEALISSVKFVSVETDGYFAGKPKEKPLKIEVYGDSITVGHLAVRPSESEPPEGQQDFLENGCVTYAFVASQTLNAELRVQARCGIGMYSAWGASYQMKNAWKDTYCSEYDFIGTGANRAWNFSAWTPDVVLINIGTNDVWFSWDEEQFKTEMRAMTDGLIEKYGNDVFIVYCFGMMTDTNASALRMVAREYTYAGKHVSALQLLQTPVSAHPRRDENNLAAEKLVSGLKKLLSV